MIVDVGWASLELGIPVAILTWLLFVRLYETGQLDRNADARTIKSSLKALKKASKRDKMIARKDGLLHSKWMKFGGGFYGVAALWTFFIIEVEGLFVFVSHPEQMSTLLDDGLLHLIIGMIVNQIINFVTALMWFGHWAPEHGNPVVWVLVAYLGYLGGLNLARIPLVRLVSLVKPTISNHPTHEE